MKNSSCHTKDKSLDVKSKVSVASPKCKCHKYKHSLSLTPTYVFLRGRNLGHFSLLGFLPSTLHNRLAIKYKFNKTTVIHYDDCDVCTLFYLMRLMSYP